MKNMYSLKPAADFTATDKRLPVLYIYIRLYTFYIILSFISCFIFIYFYVYVFMKATINIYSTTIKKTNSVIIRKIQNDDIRSRNYN